MITLPVIDVKLDPLDALLATLGARLIHLSRSDDEAFLSLIADKQVVLQFGSDDGVARYFRFNQGQVSQHLGSAETADLTINFKSSMAGAKLLTKAEMVALMQAVQDGQMVVTGDYKLLMWFASLAKLAVKIPEQYQGYIDTAKPYLQMAKPYATKVGEFATKLLNKSKAGKSNRQDGE